MKTLNSSQLCRILNGIFIAGFATAVVVLGLRWGFWVRVNGDREWISRVSETATWDSLCESQGASRALIATPYRNPRTVPGVSDSWVNDFLLPGSTVQDSDSLIMLVNDRGIVVRTGVVSDEEIAQIERNSLGAKNKPAQPNPQ